jgi:uncharacterized membrane-anchored protein
MSHQGNSSRWVSGWLFAGFVVTVMGSSAASRARAQEPGEAKPQDPKAAKRQALEDSIEWKKGPFTADLGTVAEIKVPAGYQFVAKKDMRKFNELTENLGDPNELGVLLPEDRTWFVVFSYEDVGYVKDDEKDKLDADAILKSLKEGTAAGNPERKKRGWAPLYVTGWEQPPFYDPETHNLTWVIRLESNGRTDVNYRARILGRGGVMSADLAISPEALKATIPVYKQLLTSFSYKSGQKYSEWKPGDKVAAYGLGGLILGGVGVAALKSGFLAKFWKAIVVAVVAVGGAIGGFFKKLFGGRSRAQADDSASAE